MNSSFSPLSFRRTLILLSVLILVAIVYFPCLENQFVNWDDPVHLLENEWVRSLSGDNLINIFTTTVNRIYIPLSTLSFALEYHFFQYDPFIYHFNNLFLHLCVTGLIFVLAHRCGLSMAGAVVAAILFGIHPVHVESVAWVTERKDVLCAFFYLLALNRYLEFQKSSSRFDYGVVLLYTVLSVLAKPMALSLPLVFLLCDWFFEKRITIQRLKEKIPILCFIVPFVWVTYFFHLRLPEVAANPIQAFLIWVWGFMFYIKKFLYPQVLVLFYNLPQPIAIGNPAYLGSLLSFVGILFLSFYLRRNRWYLFAVMFYVVTIFFLLRFDYRGDFNIVSDRFMYIPSIGFCLLLGYGFEVFCQKFKNHLIAKSVSILLCVFIVLVLSIKSFAQNQVWYNGVTLWHNQLKYKPEAATPLVLYKLAEARLEEKSFKQAVVRYRNFQETDQDMEIIQSVVNLHCLAIERKTNFAAAYCRLGHIFREMGLYDKAEQYYRATLEIDPNFTEAHKHLELIQPHLTK